MAVPAYEVRNLRKVYRSPPVVANDDISLLVNPGRAVGLLGPNGAGKSTLVKQLVGLLRPTSGEVRLFGEPVEAGSRFPQRVGKAVAYLPQGSLVQGEWRVAEAIVWTGLLRGCTRSAAQNDAADLMAELELTGLADRQLRKLSGGQRRLVQVAMTLVGRLPVLILDEPTADIDPTLRRRIWELLANRTRAGSAVILVTHDVAEAEHVLDQVAIIDHGRVIAADTPQELKAKLGRRMRIEVVLAEGGEGLTPEAAATIGRDSRIEGRRVSGWAESGEAVRVLEKLLGSLHPDAVEDVRLVTPTLEDVYLSLRGRTIDEEDS